jgi:hypothetical protein
MALTDPHKRSATIEAIDQVENVLAQARFGADSDRTMLALDRRFGQRISAAEGCNDIVRHIAQRLIADGETAGTWPASCRLGPVGSPPGKAARPTRSTHTRWR